jgi:hypothetical protein
MATGKGKGARRGRGAARGTGKGKGKGENGDGDDGDGGGDDREPFRESEGAIRVHQAYLEHRVGGGERATTQAYLRAFKQFQKLPGAIRSKPAVEPPEPAANDTENGGQPDDKRDSK